MRYRLPLMILCLSAVFATSEAWANRYYSPETGRFITRDSVGYSGGSLNLHEYVLSNPVVLTDPSGLVCCVEDFFLRKKGERLLKDWGGMGVGHAGWYQNKTVNKSKVNLSAYRTGYAFEIIIKLSAHSDPADCIVERYKMGSTLTRSGGANVKSPPGPDMPTGSDKDVNSKEKFIVIFDFPGIKHDNPIMDTSMSFSGQYAIVVYEKGDAGDKTKHNTFEYLVTWSIAPKNPKKPKDGREMTGNIAEIKEKIAPCAVCKKVIPGGKTGKTAGSKTEKTK